MRKAAKKFQKEYSLRSFQNDHDFKDYWVVLEEQCPESNRGWVDYYSVSYPKLKFRVPDSCDREEAGVSDFEGIDYSALRGRIVEALNESPNSEVIEIAQIMGVKLV